MSATNADATLTSVEHDGAVLTLTFGGPVQPATASLAFPGTTANGLTTGVPLAAADWTAIQATLRAISLPAVGEVPIAAQWMAPDAEGNPTRTLGDLLPASMPSSLDLPDQVTVTRVAGDPVTFTVAFSSTTPLATEQIPALVDIDGTAADADAAYGVSLGDASGPTIPLAIGIGGSLTISSAGALNAGGSLSLELGAAGTRTLGGAIGIAGVSVDASLLLDASFAFDPSSAAAPTVTLTEAQVALGPVTIPDLGPGGADISVGSGTLVTFNWPTLPSTDVEGERTETVVATDSGWATGGLQQLTSIGINELLAAPGGLAVWLAAAQDGGILATPLPIVGGTLGQSIGVSQTLGMAFTQVAQALSVTSGPFAEGEPPLLTAQNACEVLTPLRVRAAEVEAAAAIVAAMNPQPANIEAAILAELANVSVDESAIEDGFEELCGQLFGALEIDLAFGTIEAGIDIPAATFDFLSAAPNLSLGFEGAGLVDLTVGAPNDPNSPATWTGTASAAVNLTLGVDLSPASELLANNDLVVELNTDEPDGVTVDDVTVAHRVYVPAGEEIATSSVSIVGSNIAASARLGFLDLALTGNVSLTPSVSITVIDPGTGATDGRVDLAELLDAATLDPETGERNIDSVATIALAGDDVEAHFTLSNSLIGTTASLDVAGDLSGLLPSGTVEFRTTAIAGPEDVDPDTLAIGQTFGDSLSLSEITADEVIALVADLLDGLAANATQGGANQRIPLIDVTVDEMLGFTNGLRDAATVVRERVPSTITELETVVNDALAAEGMGRVTVGFAPTGPSGDPELTLTIDASLSASASYPVSFELSDDEGPLSIAPIDGGAQLDAAVQVDFEPTVGIRFNSTIPVGERVFVRNASARFDLYLSGAVDGAVRLGPLEASIDGSASIGDSDLANGGFTVALTQTSDSSATIPLSAFPSGVSASLTGSLPVNASMELDVPLLGANGTIGVTGNVPGTVTFTAPELTVDFDLRAALLAVIPDLGTLVDGTIETARFIARGADDVAAMGDDVPVVGADVTAQFNGASVLLNDVADELERLVALLESEENDAATFLETELNLFFADIGCTVCSAEVYWTGDGEDLNILNATGIEIVLTLAGSTTLTAAPTASLGLEPVVELDLDVTNASATIGFTASIGLGLSVVDGFYLFPGGTDNGDGTGTLLEIYAALDLDSQVNLTLAGLSATADADVTVSGPLNGGTAAGLKVDMVNPLPFSEIVNRSRALEDTLIPGLSADINADLPIVLNVGDGSIGVGVTLPFVFAWSFADTLSPSFDDATLDITDATLDIGSLTTVMNDTLTEFDQYNPLSLPEVQSALKTEVPLIDQTIEDTIVDLCEISGQSPATCTAFKFLANTSTMDLDEFDGDIPIGSFQIFPAPPAGESRYTPPEGFTQTAAAQTASTSAQTPALPPEGPARGLYTKLQTLTGGYLSMPILTDFPALMGIVLGGELTDEVDIVRLEIPADQPLILGPSFNFKRELLNLDIAFLEGNLSVALNGGIGLKISGGFGYSTRGITTGDPLDGVFLLDGAGNEVALGASISASVKGRFSVAGDIASVTFSGGGAFSADAGVDLFDESVALIGIGGGDGRLYFDEIAVIAQAYNPPAAGLPAELCMFQLRTTGTWNLSFSGKAKVLGITVFNESFNEGGTLWDETLSCQLRTRIAKVEDRQLILLAGPNANDRFDGEGDVAESFEVVLEGANVRVNWLPANPDKPSLVFPLSSFDTIIADMGNGNDSVVIDAGILKPVVGRGGPGADTLTGGGADDDLDGGDGNDTIDGRGGNDTIRGGIGNDTITGGAGNDAIEGGAGDDTVTFADGFGSDEVIDGDGDDTLDLSLVTQDLEGDTAYGDATIESADGSLVTYFSSDIDQVLSGAGDDAFTFKDREPDGFRFNGGAGDDDSTFQAGRRDRTVSVSDTSGTDTLTVVGTATADTFLLRAASTEVGVPGTNGFVARLAGDLADRYNYDNSIEDLTVDGGQAGDTFALDDNAATTHIVGGQGDDTIQVGQVFGLADCEPNGSSEDTCPVTTDEDSIRGGAIGADAADAFATTVITRGHLSNGVTHDLTIHGDGDNDSITVFSNHAAVQANGGAGDDNFVARAFILTASVTLNGDGGIDDFTYVVNDQLDIDGGDGVDTFTVIGTEANDGFIIDIDDEGNTTVVVCPIGADGLPDPDGDCAIDSRVESVEVFAALGLEGDDVFWIRATTAASLVQLFGGQHSDRFVIGDGTLDTIAGPITMSGDLEGVVPPMPDPLVLPGEDDTAAFEPSVTGGSDIGDTLTVDASDALTGLTGQVTDTAVRGLAMGTAPFTIGGDLNVAEVLAHDTLEFIDIELGAGDDVVTVLSSHAGNIVCNDDGCPLQLITGDGNDTVDVQAISGEAELHLGSGDDIVTVGQPAIDGDTLDAMDARLVVLGDEGDDILDLDDSADAASRIDIDPGLITEAGLHADGVTHTAVETINVRLGATGDVANVRGTATDAVATHVYGNGGDDSFYVSSVATFGPDAGTDHLGGDLDDIASPLFIHSGTGGANRLMVSDREATAGDASITYNGAVIAGLAPADISHDTDGAFGGGITIWTSELADNLTVTNIDRSLLAGVRTLTTINTGAGVDTVEATVADGPGGALALNAEEDDDTIDASASSLGLLIFGGLGTDTLTGGSGNDIILGDLGTVATEDGNTVTGGGGPGDKADGGTQPLDVITSDASGGASDDIDAGTGDDIVFAGTGADDVQAGEGDDIVLGGHGTHDPRRAAPATRSFAHTDATADTGDTLAGGPGNDLVFGQQGDDTIDGGSGDDVLIGGHTLAGGLDGADTISGGDGNDIIAGDNAAVDDTGSSGPMMLFDLATLTFTPLPGTGGADTVHGGAGNDDIYGQQGDDSLHGEAGDDYIEGNAGEDTISGGANHDDIAGGGSAQDGVLDGTRDSRTLLDGRDIIWGDDIRDPILQPAAPTDGHDVIIGDNGVITRTGENDGNRPLRSILTGDRDGTETSGSDIIRAGGGDDVAIGQLDEGSAEPLLDVMCRKDLDGKEDDHKKSNGDALCGEGGKDQMIEGTGPNGIFFP